MVTSELRSGIDALQNLKPKEAMGLDMRDVDTVVIRPNTFASKNQQFPRVYHYQQQLTYNA